MAARRWMVVAVVLAVAGAWPAAGLAQEARKLPPSQEEAVFEFLVAEVAAQRGETGPALATMERLARELRDPKIAVEWKVTSCPTPGTSQADATRLNGSPDSSGQNVNEPSLAVVVERATL